MVEYTIDDASFWFRQSLNAVPILGGGEWTAINNRQTEAISKALKEKAK